jgi:Uma2 family endonuclease
VSASSEPQPDLAVVRGTARDYVDRHPVSAALVVEVSDTSLDYDRTKKARVQPFRS